MLPNPQHAPAERAEGAGHEAVAGAVGGDLLAPKLRVGFWLSGVERAAVPAAAIDEDGQALRTGVPEGALVFTEMPVIQLAPVSLR
jgi:hypothetical protein